jgi:hypothetical protein
MGRKTVLARQQRQVLGGFEYCMKILLYNNKGPHSSIRWNRAALVLQYKATADVLVELDFSRALLLVAALRIILNMRIKINI